MNQEKVQHMYLHVDLDAFFASVEQMDHPEYKGKPVIVGGLPEERRGVVSTASYEARKFGVHSAMPVYQAYKLCPQGIYVHGNMRRYAEISYQVMSIFKDFSPDVMQMSIDEALIDLTGTEKLWGPAEETAKKIKERVKKETGLTVSVGLASTQYIAKIASGYSKPDGFYYVKPGEETDFMLSLPLDKIWGAGKKTQELIKLKGIKTTREIYEKDLDLLQFMFGPNLGSFLYNAVRGNEDMSFKREAKSHSISAETTFAYDITDIYTAETALMELCYGVYFRLLREESYSRTVTLKLRYEDFTTTNAQVTYDRNIMSLDSFFEKIKNLFETKYEKGRGIRLLGVGFDNVEDVDRPYQQDLFETENTKKSKLEKAILTLEKKHPEIKVQKARMLKHDVKAFIIGLSLFSTLFLLKPLELIAKDNITQSKGAGTLLPQEENKEINDKLPKSLFNWEIADTQNLEFLISGYWSAKFEDNISLSFGNNSPLTFGLGVPVFKQEIDISFLAVLNNTWTFKAEFADEFTKNTISLGYKGNGFLKSALISNRSITMPDYYAASFFGYGISGGASQAPGFNMHFEDAATSLWNGDFVFRYDMTQSKNATFYGLNNAVDNYISINGFEYGKSFIFPENAWQHFNFIEDVYVESKNGPFRDEKGKKYKKLTNDQYFILPSSGMLLLSTSAMSGKTSAAVIPTILITFSEKNAVKNIINDSGSYYESQSFLGKIQSLFPDYKLQDYSYKLHTSIENKEALVIQNSSGFSPFLVCQTYDCGIIKDADIMIVSKNSGIKNQDYKTELTDELASTSITNFFHENHKYVKVFSLESQSQDLQQPINRYPFALTNPEIYLNLEPKTDTALLIRSFSKVSSLNIGTSAISGTVQVFKNGTLDTGAKYDSTTGNVNLSSSINSTDKIYITWQEDSSDFGGGAIVAGAGFNYLFNPKFKTNLAITSRWPVTPFKKYATELTSQKSFTAITSGLDYSLDHLKISDKIALAVENQNGTGVLLASTQETNLSKTYYLSSKSGFKTLSNPILNTDNETIELKEENNCSLVLRPAETDINNITGYKIPLDFDFNKQETEDSLWAAIDIQIPEGSLLKKSSQIEIALKNESDMSGYDFYIQLGVNATTSFNGEEQDMLPTWKINNKNTDGLFNFSSTSWQFVTLYLEDIDRSKLTSYHDARLVIVKRNNSDVINKSGTVYIGPYEPYPEILFTKSDNNILINTYTQTFESPSAKDLLISQNSSSVLKWKYLELPSPTESTIIKTVKYFEAADFSPYKTVNLDFALTYENTTNITAFPISSGFELILDNSAKNIDENGNVALKINIKDISSYITKDCTFHTLSIDTTTNQVFIDNSLLKNEDYELEINKNYIPNRQKIVFDTNMNGALISKGSFYIDNLYYKDTNPVLSAQNNFALSYEKKEAILKIKNYELIKNLTFDVNSTQSAQSYTNSNSHNQQISAYSKAGITIADINFSGDVNLSSAENTENILQNAGHNIKTEEALFKFLSFNEVYRYSNTEKSLKKSDSVVLDFMNLNFPLKAEFSASSAENSAYQSQNASLGLLINPKFGKTGLSFTSSLKANQKIDQLIKKTFSNTDNYFYGYYDISALEFSTGDSNAQNRNLDFASKLELTLPWYKISPNLEYDLSSKYVNSSNVVLSDTHLIKFNIPLAFTNNTFSFTYTKTGIGENKVSADGDYISDGNKALSEITNRQYFYTSIPFYDLFETDSLEKLNPSSTKNETNTLSSKYEFIWKRRMLNSYKDLLIPSTTSFAISRDLKYAQTLSDFYQIKAVISNNAMNIFGSKSKLNLFNWYSQEEIQSSLSGIIKIPYGQIENTTFQAQFYNQITFFITDRNTLQTAVDFSIETNLDWNLRTTFIWIYPGKDSFIIHILNMFKPFQNGNPNWKISRKNTLNINIGRKDLINNQLYEIFHNVDINFLKNYTVTAGAGLNFNYIENSKDTLSLKFSIGAKMNF